MAASCPPQDKMASVPISTKNNLDGIALKTYL